ncbi:MAG: c-type cytochrome [Raineya sp.]|nr:c-type cytochrome [Raineya sp.]
MHKKSYFRYTLAIAALWLALSINALWAQDKADPAKGKELYAQNCATCHKIHTNATGPALKDVSQRRTEAWLIKWIRNSQSMIKSGDPIAVKLYNEWNQTAMNSFPDFTDQDIKNILAYIDEESKKQPVQATSTTAQNATAVTTPADSGYTNIILGALAAILLVILAVLLVLTSLLTKLLKQRDDLDEADKEIVESKFDLAKILGSKAFIGTVAGIIFLVIAKAGIDKVMDIGMQIGYAPTQPIPFSHKLHVGKYEIACQYCHTTVMKSKSAGIPSANICMNCHNAIKTGSPNMQKIYTYIENNQPIPWVRVHNLPDLAYFNHAQHTVAGQIACEQCHGEVKEMEVIQQRAPLTMGWCIDCHRQTLVSYTVKDANGKDVLNPYYEKLLAFHKSKGKTKFKVEDIGGLECSKCHY